MHFKCHLYKLKLFTANTVIILSHLAIASYRLFFVSSRKLHDTSPKRSWEPSPPDSSAQPSRQAARRSNAPFFTGLLLVLAVLLSEYCFGYIFKLLLQIIQRSSLLKGLKGKYRRRYSQPLVWIFLPSFLFFNEVICSLIFPATLL